MDKNSFGGGERIDRINLLEFLESNASPDKVMFSCVIQDAASNYLYAFLGRNGTTAEEFYSAWQYFFKITSTNRTSWDHNRNIKLIYTNQNHRVTEKRYLTDVELQTMCFDKHYELSGMSKHMDIDKFRAGLKLKRRKILTDNLEQVKTYIDTLYKQELSRITDGQQVPLQVWNEDLLTTLIDPVTPMHLASLIFVPSRIKRTKKRRAKRRYIATTHGPIELPPDWAPLLALTEKGE